MRTIMILYAVAFSYFFHRVLRVFAQAFVIYIFRFFSLGFSKIVFILCDIQVLKRVLQNICLDDHLSPTSTGNRCADRPPGVPLAEQPRPPPSRPSNDHHTCI
jgi:hypothetical protein